jgi:hypothetical protein
MLMAQIELFPNTSMPATDETPHLKAWAALARGEFTAFYAFFRSTLSEMLTSAHALDSFTATRGIGDPSNRPLLGRAMDAIYAERRAEAAAAREILQENVPIAPRPSYADTQDLVLAVFGRDDWAEAGDQVRKAEDHA